MVDGQIDGNDNGNGHRKRFDPSLNLGQLAVCLSVVATGLVTFYGGAADMRKEITANREDLRKEISSGLLTLAATRQRLDLLETAIAQIREDWRLTRAEIIQQLNKLMDQQSDLKAIIASQGRLPDARR